MHKMFMNTSTVLDTGLYAYTNHQIEERDKVREEGEGEKVQSERRGVREGEGEKDSERKKRVRGEE